MPKHSLLRLASKIYNVPHLILPASFNIVLDYLDSRNTGVSLMIPLDNSDPDEAEPTMDSGLAIISVEGSLSYKPVMTICGEVGTSYQSLQDDVEEAIEAGCTTIVLDMASGGGEASHVFQTAENIRSMCDDAGVKLIAYADVMACSAAYALSVIADEVIVNPSSCVGSIGCVVALMDTSKAMEQAGLKRIFIVSGEAKVPFAEDGSFKQDFLDEIQKDVNELNDEFAAFVSKYSGLDVDTIKGFQAKTFNAQEALDAGLANKVMTNKEFAQYIATLHQGVINEA